MLGDKEIIAFVGVSNADKARAFYRDTLGLTMMFEDSLSLTFIVGGIILRATLVDSVQQSHIRCLDGGLTMRPVQSVLSQRPARTSNAIHMSNKTEMASGPRPEE